MKLLVKFVVMSNLLSCQICDNMETKFVAIHNPITIFIQTMQQQCVLTGIFLNTEFARPIFIIYTLYRGKYVQTLMLRYYLIYCSQLLQINSIPSNQIELYLQKHAIWIWIYKLYTCVSFLWTDLCTCKY